MKKPNEERFEKRIENSLIQHGFKPLLYTEYDRVQCLIEEELIKFIKSTQKEIYEKLTLQFDSSTDKQICKVLNDQISKLLMYKSLATSMQALGKKYATFSRTVS